MKRVAIGLATVAVALVAGCGSSAALDPDAKLPRPTPLLRQLIGFKVQIGRAHV